MGPQRQKSVEEIQSIILNHYPKCQAVYLFGSYPEGHVRKDSDIDIAILLPIEDIEGAEKKEPLSRSDLRVELEGHCGREVDLINLRTVSTVFQKEIIFSGKRVYTGDQRETEIFEMLTLSYYQKLNEERKEILEDFYRTKRAYQV